MTQEHQIVAHCTGHPCASQDGVHDPPSYMWGVQLPAPHRQGRVVSLLLHKVMFSMAVSQQLWIRGKERHNWNYLSSALLRLSQCHVIKSSMKSLQKRHQSAPGVELQSCAQNRSVIHEEIALAHVADTFADSATSLAD